MTFPLYYFIFVYLLFLLVWVILGLIGLYHLIRFGRPGSGILLAAFYLIGAGIILQISFMYILGIDWGVHVSVLSGWRANPSPTFTNF